MSFHLRVYDSFHYSDESEADDIGHFETYAEALAEAKAIVDKFLASNWKSGITPEKLFEQYDDFGDDPSIIPDDPKEQNSNQHFSARKYAISRVEAICKELEKTKIEIQTLYQEALKFASSKHAEKGQKVPGTNLPYDVHISNVAMEILIAGSNTTNFNTAFAVQVALLHDTIEDTATDFQELENKFGIEIAKAVSALSKNNTLPKDRQMQDSLNRIKALQKEVWSVKLADRITNLQPPPSHWVNAKKLKYQQEAQTILNELKGGNEYLEKRLEAKIEEYNKYLAVAQTFDDL
jgi:guanosine-3',5'-bis(diphosphate) 3'-pyrophosphohydrolase